MTLEERQQEIEYRRKLFELDEEEREIERCYRLERARIENRHRATKMFMEDMKADLEKSQELMKAGDWPGLRAHAFMGLLKLQAWNGVVGRL